MYRIDTRGRHRLHDTALVRGGDKQIVLRGDQQVAARNAVAARRNLVEEIGGAQVDCPHQGADHFALGSANGRDHAEYRRPQLLSHGRPANHRLALLERNRDRIPVDVVGADATGRRRYIGNRRAVGAGDEDTTVEHVLQQRTLFQPCLQGDRITHQLRVKLRGNSLKRGQPAAQLFIDA